MPKFYNVTVLSEIVWLKVPDRLWTLGEVCPFKSLQIAKGFWLLSQFFHSQENLQTTTQRVGQLHKPMHVSRITFYDLHRRTGGTNTSWTSGDCPLILCVCSICALPVRTCRFQLWPRTSESLAGTTLWGQHKSKNYLLWNPGCLPCLHMCEICCPGMCRALEDGKWLRTVTLEGKR